MWENKNWKGKGKIKLWKNTRFFIEWKKEIRKRISIIKLKITTGKSKANKWNDISKRNTAWIIEKIQWWNQQIEIKT